MPTRAITRGRMPENAVRVTLPSTEVCMYLNIAGQQHWAAKVGEDAAEIYDETGRPYGPPVLLCEAGLDEYGQPKPLHEPTGIAVEIPNPSDPAARTRVVIPDPPTGAATPEAVTEQPTVKLTLSQLIEHSERKDSLAPGDPTLPIARLLVPLATPGTGGLRALCTLAGVASLSRRLSEAGWCCVLNADADVFEFVARRRATTIADALEELLALHARGTVYLDNPQETDTLSSAELRVCTRADSETGEQ
jgi:hypothetical protein